MKRNYIAPCNTTFMFAVKSELLSISAGNWDDSIKGAGSDWAGTDTDDSIYGL